MKRGDPFSLTKDQRDMAEKKGFVFEMHDRWFLFRKLDGATVWPHMDGYISAFVREGTYVHHRKFRDTLENALDRKFGDPDEQ